MQLFSTRIRILLTVFSCLLFSQISISQCSIGQSEVIITIVPDTYPGEISWDLVVGGSTVATGTSNSQTVCVPQGQCIQFNIHDSFGDGICCGYGNGSFTVSVDGTVIGTGGNYGYGQSVYSACPQGSYCANPIPIVDGNYTATFQNTYYTYTCIQTGIYGVTTCGLSACDTKIWVYGDCNAQSSSTGNAGTLFYDDDEGGCGIQAVVEGYFEAGETYLIRIGYDETATCTADTINFSVGFLSEITGCTDPNACNFNPLATISGDCYFYPDPNCPAGPDLVVDQPAIENSLNIRDQPSTTCMVTEGCLTGYGVRKILAFDTWIRNDGATDYYIGDPTNNPDQFTFGNCHGHAHYEGYAEYSLYRTDGTLIPIGQKNGFCVLDLECSGGGSAQYGCGNMGITAGCGDIYNNGLDCQWIDITDVDTGQYILAVKVNWDHSPDALGRHESDYSNNVGQVCLRLTMDALGNRGFEVLPDCTPFVDCNGVQFGNAEYDCNGDCNGGVVAGDLNTDSLVTVVDGSLYVSGILNNTLTPSTCRDISNDGAITVWDAGLAANCAVNGPSNNECEFPNSVTNPTQIVIIGNTSINTTDGYIDLTIKNPDNRVVGYEFNVSGITIGDAQNLIDPIQYPTTPQFSINGTKIISLSLIDSTIPKHNVEAPLIRIYYSQITDPANICVSGIVHVLNNLYEPTIALLEDACISVAGVEEVVASTFNLFPNPAVNEVTVELETMATTKTLVEFIDETGRVVLTSSISAQQKLVVIPVKQLTAGVYQMKIGNESQVFVKAN